MRRLFQSVMFGMLTALGPMAANATLILQGDPGPIGGTAQTMLFDLAGTNTADMSNFVIEMSPKYVELIGTGTITIGIDIYFAPSAPSTVFSNSAAIDLLDMDGLVLANILDSGTGSVGDSNWYENDLSDSFADTLFYGLDWTPFLEPVATYGNRAVTNGSLTVNFGEGDFSVGEGDLSVGVPEPATLALFGIGLAGMGFARRKRKSA